MAAIAGQDPIMRTSIKVLIPSLAIALLLAACGGSSHTTSASSVAVSPPGSAQSSGGANGLVKTASNATLGTVLVNAQGMTLYRLSAEGNGRFICANTACLQLWHPLKAPASGAPSGTVGSLDTI